MNQAQNAPLDLGPVLRGRDQEMMASQQLKAKQFSDDQAAKQQAFHQAHENALQMSRTSSGRASFKDKMQATMGAIRNNAQGLGNAITKGDQSRKGQNAAQRFGDIGDGLRQAKQQALMAKGQGLSGLKNQAIEAGASAIKQGTSELLKQAWENLIDSWGLTLIWINIHVFLRFNLQNGDKYFCALGEEWQPKMGSAPAGAGSVPIFGMPGKGFGILEIIVLAFLDVLVISLIFINLVMYAIIIYMYVHPFKAFWDFGFGAMLEIISAAFGFAIK